MEYQDFNGTSNDNIIINLSELRTKVRESLKHQSQSILSTYITSKGFSSNKFNTLYEASTTLNSSFLGMLGQRFPVFLTPSPTFDIIDLINNPTIRICWDDDYWYIVKNNANCRLLEEDDILFSFDLPDELFNLYADNNMLTQHKALNLKEDDFIDIDEVITYMGEKININNLNELINYIEEIMILKVKN